jgi:hypothetical protein
MSTRFALIFNQGRTARRSPRLLAVPGVPALYIEQFHARIGRKFAAVFADADAKQKNRRWKIDPRR